MDEKENMLFDEEQSLMMQLRLFETIYIKSKGLEVGTDEAMKLFPFGWFEPSSYTQKIKAIAEAMEGNIPILETNAYQSLMEGVRRF